MVKKNLVQLYRMPDGVLAAGINVTQRDLKRGFNSAEAGIHLVRGFWYTKKGFKKLSKGDQEFRKEISKICKSRPYGDGVGDLKSYGKVLGSLRAWGAAARPLRKISNTTPAKLLVRL